MRVLNFKFERGVVISPPDNHPCDPSAPEAPLVPLLPEGPWPPGPVPGVPGVPAVPPAAPAPVPPPPLPGSPLPPPPPPPLPPVPPSPPTPPFPPAPRPHQHHRSTITAGDAVAHTATPVPTDTTLATATTGTTGTTVTVDAAGTGRAAIAASITRTAAQAGAANAASGRTTGAHIASPTVQRPAMGTSRGRGPSTGTRATWGLIPMMSGLPRWPSRRPTLLTARSSMNCSTNPPRAHLMVMSGPPSVILAPTPNWLAVSLSPAPRRPPASLSTPPRTLAVAHETAVSRNILRCTGIRPTPTERPWMSRPHEAMTCAPKSPRCVTPTAIPKTGSALTWQPARSRARPSTRWSSARAAGSGWPASTRCAGLARCGRRARKPTGDA